MGSLTGRDVHIDVPLSNVVMAYRPEGFIGDQLFPIVNVPKQSDAYLIWSIADAYRIEDDLRAPGTEANKVEWGVESATFYCKNRALKQALPYETIQNADAGFIFTQRSVRGEMVKDKLMLALDYRLAQQITSGSNVGSYSAIASAWTDYANSKPYEDIETAIQNVEDSTGQRPNSIMFGRYAWRHFRNNDDLAKRLFGDGTNGKNNRTVSQNMIKELFELERLNVGGAYRNSADEGQTASLAKIWNDMVLVYYAPMAARIDKPSFGYCFRWNMNGLDMQARVFQEDKKDAEEIQVGYYQDEKITGKDLAFLITGVGSSQSGI